MMFRKALLPLLTLFLMTILGSGCAQKASDLDAQASQAVLYTPASLIDAVKAGDTALVQKHLASKVDVNTKDATGNSLLHLAVTASNDKMLTLLLKSGANINAINQAGFTPLHLAVSNNTQTLIDILLKASAATEIANAQGWAAIHTATKANNRVVIGMILKQQPSDLKLKTKDGLTPLLVAIESGHFQLIKYYLKNKADMNVKTNNGLTAVQLAMRSNSLQTLDFLLKKGAKLAQLTADGKTLLHLASEAGSIKIVRLLVKKGLKVGIRDKKNFLALDYAVQNAHAAVAAFLLTKYSDFSDTYKFKLLKSAVNTKDIKILLALHKGGVSLSTIQKATRTSILHYAVTLESMEPVIELILKKTELITHKDAKGLTALDLATKAKQDAYVAIMKPYYLKVQIRNFIAKDDFTSLKALVKKYPEALELIKNKKWKLSLNGPDDLMIGDIKILSKKGRSQEILVAQINRLKTGYKNFTSNEIGLLVAYGLPAPLIAAIIDKTGHLEKEKKETKEKKALKALQKALLKVQELALRSHQKIEKFQEMSTDLIQKLLEKQDQIIQEQIATREAIKNGSKAGGGNGSIADTITNSLINKVLE